MYYLKRFNLDTDYHSFNGGVDFITTNVSAVDENNKVYYNPKDTSVTFYIMGESYTIPYPMTWKEAILNPNVVTCNNITGASLLYGHMFDSRPDMHCGVDNTLYYIPIYDENGEEVESDGYVYQEFCTDCVHLGGVGCLEQTTFTLVNENNTPVLTNDKINSSNYYLVEL